MVDALDALLVIALSAKLAPVGVAVGVYGLGELRWLPHLPLECVGIALPISLYLSARARDTVPARTWLLASGASVALLVSAALIETYLTPGGLQ